MIITISLNTATFSGSDISEFTSKLTTVASQFSSLLHICVDTDHDGTLFYKFLNYKGNNR